MKLNILLIVGLCLSVVFEFAGVGRAQDAGLVVVYKQQRFFQEIPAAPALQDEDQPVSFAALVEPVAPGMILSASLDMAGEGSTNLFYDAGENLFGFEQRFDRLNELDAAFPAGDYTFHLNTLNDGPQTLTVELAGDSWPGAPRVTNLDAFRGFNSSQVFTLQWEQMSGGTTDDLILVSISSERTGEFFESPGPGESGGLDGTDTFLQVPADTFGPGALLRAEINFVRIADQDATYSGALAVYLKVTDFFGSTAGGTDEIPPTLLNSAPEAHQAGVDRGSVISFTFDEPMKPGVSIAWSGVGAAPFTYTWSPDRQTLFCSHSTGLPANTLVEWVLNPDGSPANLRDLAENPLVSHMGSFTTSSDSPTAGADVWLFILAKGRFYTQRVAGMDPLDRMAIIADGRFKALNLVTNGLYTLPNTRTVPIQFNWNHSGLDSEAGYVDQADLDLFFPEGDYQLRLDTVHDGSRTLTLSLNGRNYPNAPAVVNLVAGQSINSEIAFPLNWEAFSGGTTTDFVHVAIVNESGDKVFSSPEFGQAGALNGTATGVTVAANTLSPGRFYRGSVVFFRTTDLDQSSYPGGVFASGYFALNEFDLATTGIKVGPTLIVLAPQGTGFQAQFSGDVGVPYTVEHTEDFLSWDFFDTLFVEPENRTAVFSDPAMTGSVPRRFFRVREGY